MLTRRNMIGSTALGIAALGIASRSQAAPSQPASKPGVSIQPPPFPPQPNVTGKPGQDPAPRPESPSAPARTIRPAIMYGMIGEGETPLDRLLVAKDCGFDGIEIDGPSIISTQDWQSAQQKSGVIIHGVVCSGHWKYPLNSPDLAMRQKSSAMVAAAIVQAGELGATSILLVPAVVNERQPYDHAWDLSIEAIKPLLEVAAKANVKIAIENVWNNFLLSPMEAARYVDQFSSPAAAWHFDIGNCINTGFPDQWIRILSARTVKLHLKDFSRKKRDELGLWKGFDVEIGDGDAGWKKVMAALDETGYSTLAAGNWATAEVQGGGRTHLRALREKMVRVLAM